MNGLVSRRYRTRQWGATAAALCLVFSMASSGRAQATAANGKVSEVADRIGFAIHLDRWDPFAEANKAGAPRTGPLKVRRGELLRLTITGKLKPGYHTYPLVGLPGQTILSRLVYFQNANVAPLWPVQEPDGELVNEAEIGLLKELTADFQWSQDVLVRPDATPGTTALNVTVVSQVCKGTCVNFKEMLEAGLDISSEPPLAMTKEIENRLPEKPPAYASVRSPKTVPSPGSKVEPPSASSSSVYLPAGTAYPAMMGRMQKQTISLSTGRAGNGEADLLAFILAGVFWGAVSLITPCVFPMIPITVSFFLKQSEKEHHRPVTMALVYCTTIVIVLTVAAVALLSFFRFLSVNPWMNFALGGLFIFFALSLFGMYEIELPSGLARFTSEREGKGGLAGTIFMALTFTIISFACVAPFLGGFGGTAVGVQRPWWHSVLGGLAFSVTFAAPFFFLALFPTLLKRMPKSGSWLNSVKVVMGFLELAAALKFLRAGELLNTSEPSFFTYDFCLGLYVALCLLCGLYLLNAYRLPHDTPQEHLTVPRLMYSLLFLALGFYLLPALFTRGDGERQRPSGTVYAWVDSFLLPEHRPGGKGEQWSGNLEYAVNRARDYRKRTGQAKLIFVDFTGKSCVNCKINERNVFSKPEIKQLFQPYELVQLYTDIVPNDFYSPEERGRLGNSTDRQEEDATVNLQFQRSVFDTEQLPLYAILEPRLDNTIRVVSIYDEGRIMNEPAFAEFLRTPARAGAVGALARVTR